MTRDDQYFGLLAHALEACASYKPKFGLAGGQGTTLEQFRILYGADPFYRWVGLDSPLMYAAHKAAGGMTSIYRQLGIGCEWIFRAILQDALGLTVTEASWTYSVPLPDGKSRTLILDGRISFDDVRDTVARSRLKAWMEQVGRKLLLSEEMRKTIKGVVFEARQGYKSKDSKRQNADIANASNAYANLYIPVLLLFSTQIDGSVATRYTQAQWLLLLGTTQGLPTESTYVFCRDIIGYDLAEFFRRNSPRLKALVEHVLATLLEAN